MKRTRNTYGSTNGDNDGPTAIVIIIKQLRNRHKEYDDNTKNDNDQNDTLPVSNS